MSNHNDSRELKCMKMLFYTSTISSFTDFTPQAHSCMTWATKEACRVNPFVMELLASGKLYLCPVILPLTITTPSNI